MLHLPDGFDEALRLFGELMLLFRDEVELVVKGFG